MILINGKVQRCIDYADRGFHYGDGLFETLEICDGRITYRNRHLSRLLRGCKRLLIPCPEATILNQEISELIKPHRHAILKIIISRGTGGRGYQQPNKINVTRALSIHPFPEYSPNYKTRGVSVRFCAMHLGKNQYLAGIKHLNRLEQVLARSEWHNLDDIQEGLMLDSENNVIEGTMSNLFLVENGILLTPKLDGCGVAGIIRGIIIELAADNNLLVEKANLSKARVLAADEIFLTNSIINLWPVKDIEGKEFSIGKVTQQLSAWLNTHKTKNLQDGI